MAPRVCSLEGLYLSALAVSRMALDADAIAAVGQQTDQAASEETVLTP